MSDTNKLEAIALAEWQAFKSSKTVKLILAFVMASTAAYAQGVLQPGGGAPPVSLKEWLVSLIGGAIVLLQRHTAAGIEAKADVDAGRVQSPPT